MPQPHFPPSELRERLRGVFAFPPTPFRGDGSVDLDALRKHVRWLLPTGVSAVFACAGTGEFFSLTLEEYRAAVAAVVAEVDGRLPVLAGTGYSTTLACQFAAEAERLGADGLLALPPYLIVPEQEGLYRHYAAIADRVGIGVLLYHRDNALFTPATVARLAEHANIIGFKDGHGNMEQLARIRLEVGDRLCWMNGMPTAEATFAAFHAVGVQGYSSAISNFFPHVTLRFYNAVVTGDAETQRDLLTNAVEPLLRVRDRGRGFAVSYVKAAMNLLRLPDERGVGSVRPPLVDLDPASLSELDHTLRRIQEKYPQ
jgi:5-dehydro-4-deoxyglucarate dehydratase